MIATMLKMCASEQRLGDKKQKFKDPCYSSRIMGDSLLLKKICIMLLHHSLKNNIAYKKFFLLFQANICAIESQIICQRNR